MDHAQAFTSLQDQIQNALVSVTRTAGQLSSEDLSFQRSLDPSIATALDEQSSRLLALSSDILKSAASISELEAPVLQDVEDIDIGWRGVVDVVDSLLEKADTCLDEYTGVIKRKIPPTSEQSPSKLKKYQSLGNSFRTQNLVKPQLSFLNKPDNAIVAPWKPLLISKPHATIPLAQSLGTFTDDLQHLQYDYTVLLPLPLPGRNGQSPDGLAMPQRQKMAQRKHSLLIMGTSSSTNSEFRYKHPYETEILELQYPDSVYHKASPIPSQDVELTKATFVDTFEGVLAMLAELKEAKEIAIDLEHHDARSYVGLVSLMQISTRQRNWIVDTLRPWRQDLQILNEVFADPKIIKVINFLLSSRSTLTVEVFHGAHMDILWLQRDLGLYVVGLFDTHHASRVLGYPGGSLAYLLKIFVNFDADKKYQMADWRIRPLPEEMFFYAMTDTHFLLYIFDNLRNELVERSDPITPEENRIELVLQKSKETSLLRFERQIYEENTGLGPAGWYNLLEKTPALFSNEQFAVFRAIHAWRDQVARKDDDSISYVMPNRHLFTVSKLMPTDMVSLYGALHPISHNVKLRTAELITLIKLAKDNGKDGPSMMDILLPDSIGASTKTPGPSAAFGRIGSERNLAPNLPMVSTQLRTSRSSFWGGAFGSSVWDPSTISVRDINLKLAVPMPHLASEPLTDLISDLTDRPRLQDEKMEIQNIQATQNKIELEEEEAFTIKKGRKRKAMTPEEEAEVLDILSKEYDISLNDEEEEEAREKAARKAAHKAQKKLEKAAKKLARADGTAIIEAKGQDEEPFDYGNADSVLQRERNDVSRPFDPYTKSSNAPKGMRKLQTERPGRSFTFKS